MTWLRWLRWPWLRARDSMEALQRAEHTLRETQRKTAEVRREAARPIEHDEFVTRVRRAFQ